MSNEPELFQRMRVLDDTEKFSYAEKGRICLQIKNSLIHRERIDPDTGEPCSLSAWVRLAAPWGYAVCFSAMRDIESLSDVPMEDLSRVPEKNFPILKQLSTAVRSLPTVLQSAKTQRSDMFIEHIKKHHPDQHIESKRTLRFIADESQAEEIEEALTLAMEHGAMNRTEALLAVCLDYRASAAFEEIVKDLK